MNDLQQLFFHGWQDLPTELKLEVLGHLLILVPHNIDWDIDRYNHPGFLTHNLFPLIAVRNRELATLAQGDLLREGHIQS
jgi:hypothetical protein